MNNIAEYILKLKDQISGTLKNIHSNTKKMNKEMEHSSGLIKNLAEAAAGFFAVSEAFSFGKDSLRTYNEATQAQAGLQQALIATKGVSGQTMESLARLTEQVDKHSTYTKIEIEQSEKLLLASTHLRGEMFEKTMPLMMNYAAFYHTTLPESAALFARAMTAPEHAMRMLMKAGVDLNTQQKQQLKIWMDNGEVQKAQGFILDQLKGKWEGAADLMTKTGTGPLTMIKKKFEEVKIQVGELIMKGIAKLLPYIEKMVEYIKTSVVPMLKSFGDGVMKVFNFLIEHQKAIKAIIIALGIYVVVMKTAVLLSNLQAWYLGLSTGAIIVNTLATEGLTAAMVALDIAAAANPFGIIALAAAGAATAIYLAKDAVKDAVKEMQKSIMAAYELTPEGKAQSAAQKLLAMNAASKMTDAQLKKVYDQLGMSIPQNLLHNDGTLKMDNNFGGVDLSNNAENKMDSMIKEKNVNITISIAEMNGIKNATYAGATPMMNDAVDGFIERLFGVLDAGERMAGERI